MGPGSDIYSLGLICYELPTGHPLFAHNPDEILTRKLTEIPSPGPLPDEYGGQKLEAIIQKMIAVDPGKRYGSPQQVLWGYAALASRDVQAPRRQFPGA